MEKPQSVSAQNTMRRSSDLEKNDSELYNYLVDKITKEATTLLVGSEVLKQNSINTIAYYVAQNNEKMGTPLTRERIDGMGLDIQELIIQGTVARAEQDNDTKDDHAIINDRGEVMGKGSEGEMRRSLPKLAGEERAS